VDDTTGNAVMSVRLLARGFGTPMSILRRPRATRGRRTPV
jgi:hypothetical protein